MTMNTKLFHYEIDDMFVLEGVCSEKKEDFGIKENTCQADSLIKLHNATKMLFPSYFLRFSTLENIEEQDEDILNVLLEIGSEKAFMELKNRYLGNLEQASEEFLVISAQRKNGEYERDLLTRKYESIVEKIINRVERRYFFRGQERDDLLQEAFMGFLKAIEVYKVERRTKFREFSRHVIERHLGTLMNRSKNLRNRALNESFSYNMPVNTNNETTFEDLLEGEAILPEEIFVKKEMYYEIEEKLTENELEVLKYYANGLTYEQIAYEIIKNKGILDLNDISFEELIEEIKENKQGFTTSGISFEVVEKELKKRKKSVDNTIQRIRNKGKEHYESTLQ